MVVEQEDLDDHTLATEAMEEAQRVSSVEVVPSVDHDYQLKDTNRREIRIVRIRIVRILILSIYHLPDCLLGEVKS